MGGNQSTDGIAAGSSGPQGWGMESAPDASPIVHTPADGQDCPVCMGGQHSSSFLGCLPRHMVLAVRAPASVMGATSGGGGVAEQEGIGEGVHQGYEDGRFHQQGQQADETAESLVGAVAAEASTGGRSRHQEELRGSPWGSIRRTTLQPSSCLGPQLGDALSHHGGGEEESSRLLHQAVRLTALQRLLHSYKSQDCCDADDSSPSTSPSISFIPLSAQDGNGGGDRHGQSIGASEGSSPHRHYHHQLRQSRGLQAPGAEAPAAGHTTTERLLDCCHEDLQRLSQGSRLRDSGSKLLPRLGPGATSGTSIIADGRSIKRRIGSLSVAMDVLPCLIISIPALPSPPPPMAHGDLGLLSLKPHFAGLRVVRIRPLRLTLLLMHF